MEHPEAMPPVRYLYLVGITGAGGRRVRVRAKTSGRAEGEGWILGVHRPTRTVSCSPIDPGPRFHVTGHLINNDQLKCLREFRAKVPLPATPAEARERRRERKSVERDPAARGG